MLFRILLLISLMIVHMNSQAEDFGAPPELASWHDWLLYEHDYVACPFVYTDETYSCVWTSSTLLDVDKQGARFEIIGHAFAPRWLNLPSKQGYWPKDVMQLVGSSRKPLMVREYLQRPQVKVEGKFHIEGFIPWQSIPTNLALPNNSGIIHLVLNGRKVAQTEVDSSGALWLRKQDSPQQALTKNTEQLQVYRLLSDTNPAELTTHVILDVSGDAREFRAGQLLLDGFVPLSLSSDLPARIEQNGDLRVQVKPGRWRIVLRARHKGPLASIQFRRQADIWPASEVWAFKAQRHLRTVQVQGVEAVDPNQSQLPHAWRAYPAYRLMPDMAMNLKQLHRGDPSPAANNLSLSRDLFLDFNGDGFTVKDQITGEIKRSWRLDSHESYMLGSVLLDSKPQLITLATDGKTQGLELRNHNVDLHAVGRIDGIAAFNTSGWREDFERVSSTLHLPPGWSLLASTGIDQVSTSWVDQWNLWKIFLLLIIVVALYRVIGMKAALLGLMALLVVFHRDNAPLFIWLNLLAAIALIRISDGNLQRWIKRYHALSFVALLIILLPFCVRELRLAVFPQLSDMHFGSNTSEYTQAKIDLIQAEDIGVMSDQKVAEALSRVSGVQIEQEAIVTGMRASSREANDEFGSKSKLKVQKKRFQYTPATQQYDPNAVVQTGPGLPDWRWQSVSLRWSGPVTRAETMQFYLAPPWLNRLGHLFAVVFSLGLAWLLFTHSQFGLLRPVPWSSILRRQAIYSGTFVLLCSVQFVAPTAEANVLISEDLLDEYQQRLIASPDCEESCVAIQSAQIREQKSTLYVAMVVDVQDHIAVGLPVWRAAWIPSQITVNGEPALVKFSGEGQLMVSLTAGRHHVQMQGSVFSGDIELNFGRPANNVEVELVGWEVNGLHKGFVKTGTLQLQRRNRNIEKQDVLLADPIPPFVEIHRQVELGLEWKVHTTVSRIAPSKGAMSLTIPLLAGESIISDIQQENGAVKAVFGPNQQQLQWTSVLSKSESIALEAADSFQSSEVWTLNAWSIWHIESEGISPIKRQDERIHTPTWRPWPGEKVLISVSRPNAIKGPSLTIDSTKLHYRLGKRSDQTTLDLQVRTSRGAVFPFTLPAGAVLESLAINDVSQPIVKNTGELSIPLRPGKQAISLQWKSEQSLQVVSTTPSFTLGWPAANVRTTIVLPHDRWALLVGGSGIGPVILLWSILLVVVIVAFFLSRSTKTPLRFHHWSLLGLGVCSTNLISPVIIVLWLFALGFRGQYVSGLSRIKFRFMQVGLVVLTLIGLVALLSTIPMGLLSSPDMHVAGNGSYGNIFHWFQDKISGDYLQAWVLSVPMWVYRVAMLVWSLWLAFALLKWLQWGWEQLNVGGLWNTVEAEKSLEQASPPAKK